MVPSRHAVPPPAAPPPPSAGPGRTFPMRPPTGSPEPIPGRCGARLVNGRFCKQYPRRGGVRCDLHGQGSPQGKAAAARRVALQKATAAIGDVAPIDVADALESAVARLHAGVLAHAAVAANGAEEAETYRRWLVDLGKLARDVHAAGLDERRVRISEATRERLGQAFDGALADAAPILPAGVADEYQAALRGALARRLRDLVGGEAAR